MLGSLGPYHILSPLGAGGMGDVYLATDTRLNRNVAIKVLPAIIAANDEAQRRMLREARMVATIDHPNVCTIYDIGEDADRSYIVMQYIQGETLSERMRRGRLDLGDTIGIARQITLALAEAHSRGIVHRDIKPGNIMISSAGVVKVLDFGLATSTAHDTDVTELMVSREGMVMGTTAYMSPEQLRAEPLDGRSDIFSLGVVLYEIAAGARPFDRPTLAATITAILTEDPPPLDTPLQPLIARALAKPVSRRYASAAALHQALTELGEGRRPSAPRKQKTSAIESIAVLPLVCESVDASFDYVAEGLLDRIVARLSHVPHLKVVRYRGQIPAEPGVQAVISGRVAVAPASLTLQLDMKDARSGSLLRQRTFERSGRPIEELAVDVAGQIAGSGKPRTKKRERAVDPAAEKLYLRGRFQWNKRHAEAVRQAIACFQEAIERDPLYANAYAGLADAYLMLGFLQVLPPRDVIPKAKAAALRAIELDTTLAEPRASFGYLAGMFDWDWETARRELSEAMRINPNYPWAPHWYGLLAAPTSLDEAMTYVTRARDLDPLSPIINTAIGVPLHQHRRYHEAVRIYSQVLETEASFAPAHHYLGLSYEQLGDYEAAIANMNRAVDIAGRSALFVGALGHCYGASGHREAAETLRQELEMRSADRYVSPYNVMLIHLGLGETDLALTWLERALEDRTGFLWMTPREPRFDPLRGDPRFREMVARHGLRSEP
jgi:eukaryotic-like serine/threonine-protein kinase